LGVGDGIWGLTWRGCAYYHCGGGNGDFINGGGGGGNRSVLLRHEALERCKRPFPRRCGRRMTCAVKENISKVLEGD